MMLIKLMKIKLEKKAKEKERLKLNLAKNVLMKQG
jgi:hypothetical protein